MVKGFRLVGNLGCNSNNLGIMVNYCAPGSLASIWLKYTVVSPVFLSISLDAVLTTIVLALHQPRLSSPLPQQIRYQLYYRPTQL